MVFTKFVIFRIVQIFQGTIYSAVKEGYFGTRKRTCENKTLRLSKQRYLRHQSIQRRVKLKVLPNQGVQKLQVSFRATKQNKV